MRLQRYIKSSKTKDVDIDTSMFKGTPFQCKTWMSYYDNFLNAEDLKYMQKAKNRTGEIRMMTPEQYYKNCSLYGFSHYVSIDDLKRQRSANKRNIDRIKKNMENGTKYALCMINKADHSQEGLHRMMAAGEVFGWNKKFPVLVITPYDQEKEDRWKLIAKADDFRDSDFKNYCKWASTKISSWNKPVPDNFIELYRNAIFELFNDSIEYKIDHIDIDFDIEINDNKVRVYLTKYGSYEFDDRYNPFEIWLDDLYDVSGDYSNYKGNSLDDSDLFI